VAVTNLNFVVPLTIAVDQSVTVSSKYPDIKWSFSLNKFIFTQITIPYLTNT